MLIQLELQWLPADQERGSPYHFWIQVVACIYQKQMKKKFTNFLIPEGLRADIGRFFIIWGHPK